MVKRIDSTLFAALLLALFATTATAAYAAAPAAEDVSVTVNPRLRCQTVEGWGTSLCWWAHMVGRWQDEKKIDDIVDMVVSPDKLNMNIFRYNIGGGDDPSHYSTPGNPGHMAQKGGKGIRAEMEGFKASPDAPYDWTRDAGQIKVMLKIREKRPDAIFEAFSNSPPYWMTYSGCAGGNDPGSTDNLKPEYYDAFCDYMVAVCKHMKDAYGIEFKTLEPFNESQSAWWRYLGSQEGCHFDVATQIEIIKRLYPKLKKAGLKTMISASDDTRLSLFNKALDGYLDDGKVLKYIGQLNVHTYNATDAERMTTADLVKKCGKPFWQSETGMFEKKGFLTNLNLAQKCISDMRIMKPQAWINWQVVAGDQIWGSIVSPLEPGDESYTIGKYFYVSGNISRFIKSGYVILNTDQENTLAAVSPSGKELVVCFVNVSGKDNKVKCDLSSFAVAGSADVYVTDADRNCEKGTPLPTDDKGILEFTAADQSISTFVIPVALKK